MDIARSSLHRAIRHLRPLLRARPVFLGEPFLQTRTSVLLRNDADLRLENLRVSIALFLFGSFFLSSFELRALTAERGTSVYLSMGDVALLTDVIVHCLNRHKTRRAFCNFLRLKYRASKNEF